MTELLNAHLLQIRVSDEFLERLDRWRSDQRPIASRAEAIRLLVAQAFAKEGKRK